MENILQVDSLRDLSLNFPLKEKIPLCPTSPPPFPQKACSSFFPEDRVSPNFPQWEGRRVRRRHPKPPPAEASGCYGLEAPLSAPPTIVGALVTIYWPPHPHSHWAFPQPINRNTHNEKKVGEEMKACLSSGWRPVAILFWGAKLGLRTWKRAPSWQCQTTPTRGLQFGGWSAQLTKVKTELGFKCGNKR